MADPINRQALINADNVIEVVYERGMTLEKFTTLNERVFRLADELESRDLPIRLLVDTTGFEGFDPRITKMSRFVLEDIPFEKMAVIKVPNSLKQAFVLISTLMKLRGKVIEQFASRNDALKWLKG